MGVFDYLPAVTLRQRYRPKPSNRDEALRRWPRLTAHVIAESLGYATPSLAALIILDASHRRENWCEWIYSCYNRDALPAVRGAIRSRQSHKGYMAEYKLAYALVRKAIDEGKEPMFASWF